MSLIKTARATFIKSIFLNHIKEKPLIAFIFGSTAKGTFESKSDIDIFLIYNKKHNKKEIKYNELKKDVKK